MGFLSGILPGSSSSSASSQQTSNTTTNVETPVNIGGDANAPVLNFGNSNGNSISLTDQGAVQASFSLAERVADGLLQNTRDIAERGFGALTESGSQVSDAVSRSLAFVGQQLKGNEEKTINEFTYLVLGLAAIVAVGLYLVRSK